MRNPILIISVFVVLTGCAAADGGIMRVEPYNPADYQTEIICNPSGARIEVEDDIVGTAPCHVDLNKYRYYPDTIYGAFTRRGVIIIAIPNQEGYYTQIKVISSKDPTPAKVFFDMRLKNEKPAANR